MSTQPITYRRLLAATRLLDRSFYERPTIDVAPDLLGKVIVHKLAGQALAARIVELAGPGEILASEPVIDQLGERYETDELGPVVMRGIPDAVRLFKVQS